MQMNKTDLIKMVAEKANKPTKEVAKYAVGDPKLLTIIAKTEYELISRSVDLMIYINNIALQGGEKNLMDNKQRIDLCIHVVNELRRMRGLAYAVCRQMIPDTLMSYKLPFKSLSKQVCTLACGYRNKVFFI